MTLKKNGGRRPGTGKRRIRPADDMRPGTGPSLDGNGHESGRRRISPHSKYDRLLTDAGRALKEDVGLWLEREGYRFSYTKRFWAAYTIRIKPQGSMAGPIEISNGSDASLEITILIPLTDVQNKRYHRLNAIRKGGYGQSIGTYCHSIGAKSMRDYDGKGRLIVSVFLDLDNPNGFDPQEFAKTMNRVVEMGDKVVRFLDTLDRSTAG